MSCFPDLTYSIYADGELPAVEAGQVELHLAACSRCRALVDALRTENRVLTALLEEAEEEAAAPLRALPRRRLAWMAGTGLAAAIGLESALRWLTGVQLPPSLEWLNPFRATLYWNLFTNGLFFFIREGVTMLLSVFAIAGDVLLGLLLLSGALWLLRRRPLAVSVLATLAVAAVLAQPGYAMERRKGVTVTVPAGQTVNDTLLAYGDSVLIDGVVTGNLVAFGKRLSIKGTVKGDVIFFGQTLDVDGTVGGNLFSCSQWATIRGQVAGSTLNFGQSVELASAGRVDADVNAFGSQVSLDGAVGRDALAAAGSLDVRGNIGRDLTSRGERVTLLAPARVGGNFDAYAARKQNVHIDPGTTIAGKTDIHLHAAAISKYKQLKFYIWQLVWLVAAFVLGLVLLWLFPAAYAPQSGADTAGGMLRRLGIGFLVLVATPLAAVLVGITVIGLPVAVTGLVLWLLGLYLAKVFVASWIGNALAQPPAAQVRESILALLLGLVIVSIAINLPYIGGLLHFLVILMGLGIAFLQARRGIAARRELTI